MARAAIAIAPPGTALSPRLTRRLPSDLVGRLDDQNVVDLLFGETDPRQLALFLAHGPEMDPVERDQRLTILNALNAHQTAQLARATARLATWTTWIAIATFLVAVAALIGVLAGD